MKIQTRIKQRKIKGRWNYEGVASAVLGGRRLQALRCGSPESYPGERLVLEALEALEG